MSQPAGVKILYKKEYSCSFQLSESNCHQHDLADARLLNLGLFCDYTISMLNSIQTVMSGRPIYLK